MIVRAAPSGHFRWLQERTGLNISEGFRAIEAEDEHGRICAMVGYDDWTPNSVQMHVVLDYPAAGRWLLRPAFEYPFIEADRRVAIGVTPGHNLAALKFNAHLGFREVCRIRDGWADGVDVVIQEMRREECRWIRRNHGRQGARAA